MEMHPLASAPHSFKELGIHIGIVTVGILIALSLEGVRESIHEHGLVREARASFRLEIEPDIRQMTLELAKVDEINHATHAVIADLPELEKDPAQLKQRVDGLMTSGYTLTSSSWEGALSSGALSHMRADEVSRYAGFDYDVRFYANLEDQALTQEIALHSYVDSRHTFGPQEMVEVESKLRSFEALTQVMTHLGGESIRDMKKALPN
jgi:hypothetical protein